MKFAVDKIIDNIVVLENLSDGTIIHVSICELPLGIKESDVLILENNIYKLDNNEKENRINILREKMARLKNNN